MAQPTNETGIAAVVAPAVTVDHALASKQQSTREAIDDGIIMARLRARLMADVVTRTYVIQVESFHDALVLSGYVELATVRIRALALARELAGGKEVKDALETRE